jgi:hypothetical protein
MVDGSQLTEDEKDAAGLMTRQQRIQHEQIVRTNAVDPADVEHVHEAEDDDPWTEPGRPPRTASRKALQTLADLFKALELGPKHDTDALVAWVLGNKPYTGTAKQVGDLTKWLESHLTAENVGGDVDKARDAIWLQYRKANEEDASDT